MREDIFEIRKSLQSKLNPMRYEHTLGVSFTCMALAMKYGCDLDKAELAGLLHDCAKRYNDETIIRKCEKHGIELTDGERRAPAVIHAKLGAWMAKNKYGVADPEILSAIACHTTGKPAMSLLDKILYVADYIEPRRDKAPDLPRMRKLAFEDLDEALYQILAGTLGYLEQSGGTADTMTEETYEYYRALRETSASDEGEEAKEDAMSGVLTEKKEAFQNDGFKGINKNRRKGIGRQKRRRR